jgi:hypothetical protein
VTFTDATPLKFQKALYLSQRSWFLPSALMSSKQSLSFRFSDQDPVQMMRFILRPCVTYGIKSIFMAKGISPNPQAGVSFPISCPWLLIQYIRSYPSYLGAIAFIRNLRINHAVARTFMLMYIYLNDISHTIWNMTIFDNSKYDMESIALIEINHWIVLDYYLFRFWKLRWSGISMSV